MNDVVASIDEAEKLARELRNEIGLDQGEFEPSFKKDIRRLCDYILSGDHKREIERAARWCECEDIERDPDDLYSGRAHRAAAIRALIHPPAQKETGE